MEPKQPFLEICSPSGQHTRFVLTQQRVTIGREGFQNDIPLGPDPDHFVSRSHCYLERDKLGWWLIENGKNATALSKNEDLRELQGRELVTDGSVFCILGYISEGGERGYWQITLHDPEKTRSALSPVESVSLRYDRVGGKLFRIRGKESKEILLTRLEYRLINHMMEQNRHAHDTPVFCTNEELLEAVYGRGYREQTFEPGLDNLRHLVRGLRRKLEFDAQKPQFLITHPGQGYLLHTYPSS